MKQTKFISISILLLFLFTQNYLSGQDNSIKPNIIIFYADDLGWQDTQLNNLDTPSPWETPNVLKLAQEGMNFTNAYSPAPTCAPSRCAMLTGMHPTKTGVTHVAGGQIPKQQKYSTMIPPFFPLGLESKDVTIAEVLKTNGYTTGHVGKWHVGSLKTQKSTNQGFDFSFESRGAHTGPSRKQNRINSFATDDANDPYRLSKEKYAPFSDKNPKGISYPNDDVTEQALAFMKKSNKEPFFLYLAHWMVHTPIHTKNRALLQYYCDKLGVDFPKENIPVTTGGQTNPYYGAMVTTLDWSLGKVVDFLKTTNDPRNPGKKLFETTYIFFSSDNGGCEKARKEIITDNFPLDHGKKYAQEGGIRVPMVISGPNIPKGKTYEGLINQLDFFPTLLNITKTNTSVEQSEKFDGLNISGVLFNNEKDILTKEGKPREDLWWHFPHNTDSQMQSAIRSGDYKLYKNHRDNSYSLFRLYEDGKRTDLEEAHNIANQSGDIVKKLSEKLEKYLTDYNAEYPYKNPLETKNYLGKEKAVLVPKIIEDVYDAKSNTATIEIETGKAKIKEAYALIRIQDDHIKKGRKVPKKSTTYVKIPVKADNKGFKFTAKIPKYAFDYVIILIDENQFMIKSNLKLV